MSRPLIVYVALAMVSIPIAAALGWGLWATAAWLAYGHPRTHGNNDPLIANVMPRFEVDERQERTVAASSEATFRAVQRFALGRSPVIRAIFRARALMLHAHSDMEIMTQAFLPQALAIGWRLLEEVPGRELVFGAVTQPWRSDVQFAALPRDQFIAFDSAGYVKIIWAIAVDALGPRRARVRTETRVTTTDPTARAIFRRYWAIFSPGILLIRYEALRAIARDAEHVR
jgi:hypothetical protein